MLKASNTAVVDMTPDETENRDSNWPCFTEQYFFYMCKKFLRRKLSTSGHSMNSLSLYVYFQFYIHLKYIEVIIESINLLQKCI